MRPTREMIRLARRIHTAYEHGAPAPSQIHQIDWPRLRQSFDDFRRSRRLLTKAMSHGWRLAAQLQQQALVRALNYLRHIADEMHTRSMLEATPLPAFGDLIGEVRQLQNEFGALIIDWKQKTMSVETDAIVLEDLNLGPFRLRLHWPRLAVGTGIDCFEIVAQAPKPAGNDQYVTHPHVRHCKLCAGEATLPLQRALEQGRLVDAFCLIRGVIETYNDSSAYVRLKDWEGISCWSCGGEMSGDDRSFCEHCEHDVCQDCMLTCKHCDLSYCSSCLDRCDVCNEPCCSSCRTTSACSELACCADCLKPCLDCEEKVARSEIDKSTGLCPECLEASEREEDDSSEESPVPSASQTETDNAHGD